MTNNAYNWVVSTAYNDNDPSIHQAALFCKAGLKNLVFTFPASYSLINKAILYIFSCRNITTKRTTIRDLGVFKKEKVWAII